MGRLWRRLGRPLPDAKPGPGGCGRLPTKPAVGPLLGLGAIACWGRIGSASHTKPLAKGRPVLGKRMYQSNGPSLVGFLGTLLRSSRVVLAPAPVSPNLLCCRCSFAFSIARRAIISATRAWKL